MTQEIVKNTSTEALNPACEQLNNLIGNILRAIAMDPPPKPFEEHGLGSVASEEDITEYQLKYLEVLRECAQAALYLALTGKLEKSIKPEHPVLDSIEELVEFLHVNPDELERFIDPKFIAEHETNRRFASLQEAVKEAVANTPESSAVKVMEYLLSSDPYNPESSTPTSKWFDEFLNQHPELAELDPLYYAAILTSASRYQDAINCIEDSPNLTEDLKQIAKIGILRIELSDPNIRIEDVSDQIRGLKDLSSWERDQQIAEILVNRASNDPSIPIETVSAQIRGLGRLTPRKQDQHIAEILINRAINDPRIPIENVSAQIRELGRLTPKKQDQHIAEILINRAINDPDIRIKKVSDQIRGLEHLDIEDQDRHIARILVNRALNDPSIRIEDVSDQIRGLKDLSSWERDQQIAEILVNRASNNPSIPIETVSKQIRGLKGLGSKNQDWKIARILVNRALNDPRIPIETVSAQIRELGRLTPSDQDWKIARILVNRASNDPRIPIEKVSKRIRGLEGLDPEDRGLYIARILVNRASRDINTKITDLEPNTRKPFIDKIIELYYNDPRELQQALLRAYRL